MTPPGMTEMSLVEEPALALLEKLGWEVANAAKVDASELGRADNSQVVLGSRLLDAVKRLNPGLSESEAEEVVEQFTQDRSTVSAERANSEIYNLLRGRVLLKRQTAEGETETVDVDLIDWNNSDNNDWLAVNQFTIEGDLYKKRPDIILFVNGIPLVVFELKNIGERIKDAYDKNIRDYRDTIPNLFWYNAFVILSNGSDARMGSTYAPWAHFSEWKKIAEESESGEISLVAMIRATCAPARLLDIVENFVTYSETEGGFIKKVAKNHQYLGVNNAIDALYEAKQNDGKLGVFWHTQGSGKTQSMLWFTQKVLRRQPGKWTFVMVTDRKELDNQLYEGFADSGAITSGDNVHAESSAHLRELLGKDHRYIFTLIHKFLPEDRNEDMPVLSDRDDIIVITDEAHRSQYDTLASNMRAALPNAMYLGFTGTPLIDGEEQMTRRVFGDYVSIYNFADSIADGATVPLYYENRIPELQLENQNFDADVEELLEAADLDEEQERLLQRRMGKQYELITRPKRLEEVAKDLVEHFANRGFKGKGMCVAVDKATAVKMHQLVSEEWQAYIEQLEVKASKSTKQAGSLGHQIEWMKQTDMAVVVSSAQNEIDNMRAKGLDIEPHRRRMADQSLDKKFKDPDDPLRLVFVCAMWLTGFDSPSVSTLYLDKPMKGHTLMQTIARANRIFKGKDAGLIVDYLGVFRNLEKALAIYGAKLTDEQLGAQPIQATDDLQTELIELLAAADDMLAQQDMSFHEMQIADGFELVRLIDFAAEELLVTEETRRNFITLSNLVRKKFRALLPDPVAIESQRKVGILRRIQKAISAKNETPDISEVTDAISALLDESVGTNEYLINAGHAQPIIDLNEIDFEQLALEFADKPRTAIKKASEALTAKAEAIAKRNPTYIDLAERVRQLIDDYNTGTLNANELMNRLGSVHANLDEYEERFVQEGLSEEELAIFDLLSKPVPEHSDKEQKQVKLAAQKLLEHITDKLVLDWHKKQAQRSTVKTEIRTVLDSELPDVYERTVFDEKCSAIYDHIYKAYHDDGTSEFDTAVSNNVVTAVVDTANPFAAKDSETTRLTQTTPAAELVKGEETRSLEFKQTARWNVRESQKDKLMEQIVAKTVAGFLNSAGGTLLIGVDDSGKPTGLDQDIGTVKPASFDGLVNWLDEMIYQKLGRTARHRIRIQGEYVDGILICRVDVAASAIPVFAEMKGKEQLFERLSNSTRAVDESDYEEFLRDRFPDWDN